MKRLFTFLVITCMVLFLSGCAFNELGNENNNEDAIKFKNEYEGLNGEKNSGGTEYRKLDIGIDNPFVYKTEDELVNLINDEESFIVYFGFNTCPWCRSVLPSLIDASKDNGITKIYYVDVLDIRNTMEVVDGKAQETKKGTDGYYKLLDLLGDVLDDYSLEVDVNQKRIYAPNVVSVVKGKAISLTGGVSEDQTDAYMELTDKMKEDMYNSFDELFKEYNEKVSLCTKGQGC